MPPDSDEKTPMFALPRSGWRICGAMKLMAKKPKTIVGMPAIVSSIGLITFRTRGEAYSARRIAASNPSGTATSIAMPATSTVPDTSGQIPKT